MSARMPSRGSACPSIAMAKLGSVPIVWHNHSSWPLLGIGTAAVPARSPQLLRAGTPAARRDNNSARRVASGSTPSTGRPWPTPDPQHMTGPRLSRE
jgi:hypothetical protein